MQYVRFAAARNLRLLMALVDRFSGVIFDYGGVLVGHQTEQDRIRLAEIAGVPVDVFDSAYWPDRGVYDKGLVTAEDYWNDIAKKAGTQFTGEQMLHLIDYDNHAWMRFDEQMYAFVDELKAAGKRIAVLSNMPRELGEALKPTSAFRPFHHITLSYELRSIKPEPEIYKSCLAGLGTKAEDTLFLDDRIENIEGSRALGIYSVQFTSRDEVLPGLRR